MRLAVISDLHLGRGDAADRFGHDDGEFVRFLRALEADHERIVLLGDVYETLTSEHPSRQIEELARVREAHPEVVARLGLPRYTYVVGNHDAVAARVLGAVPELALQDGGARLLFSHGHLHDWLIREARQVAETLVWLGGWLQRLGLKGFFHLFDALDPVLRGSDPRHPERCSFQRWAVAQALRRRVDVIVTGHTHEGRRSPVGSTLYLNSGTCSEGRFEFLSLDTRSGDFRFCTNG